MKFKVNDPEAPVIIQPKVESVPPPSACVKETVTEPTKSLGFFSRLFGKKM
jgi:hypothetical protein